MRQGGRAGSCDYNGHKFRDEGNQMGGDGVGRCFYRRLNAYWLAVLLVFSASALSGQMRQQEQCSQVVKRNIERTKLEKPDVFATVAYYTFEWSRRHQSCVMVIQYRVRETGKPSEVQILAINAVTMQPMEGTKNIFLLPATEKKGIEDSTNFLIERWSH